jgi:hypothetical protein
VDWFVAMMRPVNSVTDCSKRVQPGEDKNKKERGNNQPLMPAKPAQSFNDLLHNELLPSANQPRFSGTEYPRQPVKSASSVVYS